MFAQTRGLPPGPMQEKARTACLPCHDARIIVQQRLDRRGWTKDIDKMVRWGAPVAAEDREALISYFAQHFGPGEAQAPAPATLPQGTGAAEVRGACLSCHDADLFAREQLDRRGWARTMDRMIRWGAVIRPEDREPILNYLAANYGPPAKAGAPSPRKAQR